jgi:hypothetical protein
MRSDEDGDAISIEPPKRASTRPPAKQVSMEEWILMAANPGGVETARTHGMRSRSSAQNVIVAPQQNQGGSIEHQARQRLKKHGVPLQALRAENPSETTPVEETPNESSAQLQPNQGGSRAPQAKHQPRKKQATTLQAEKPSEMEPVEESPNESSAQEHAHNAPPSAPEKCCCGRRQCTEDVTLSQIVCSVSQQRMSSQCCAPMVEDRDAASVNICITCANDESR